MAKMKPLPGRLRVWMSPPMAFTAFAADGQTEAQSGAVSAAPRAEGRKQDFGVPVWEAAALVFDFDEDSLAVAHGTHGHVAVGSRVLEGVLQGRKDG
jgi:hypothetical protein